MNKINKKIKELNLSYINLSNQNYVCGKYDLPYIRCPKEIDIDFLALYNETSLYHKTNNTAVCFYQFDIKFDNIRGLFQAIYYNDSKLLSKYKKRFEGVKYAIAPDYSQIGDIERIENIYRLFKSRIVSLWLTMECDIIVIPNITYASEDYFDVMLNGMEETEVVAFSVKGLLQSTEDKKIFFKALKYVVNNLKYLKKIVVYSVSSNDNMIYEMFEYAYSRGIEVIIPENTLKRRNSVISEAAYGKS